MCGVFGLSKRSLDDRYSTVYNVANYLKVKDWGDRYNIRPTQSVPVIVKDGEFKFELMRFGLIPSWAKTEKLEYSTINAKSETVDKLPTYKNSFKNKRCLVPADFFYEFHKSEEGSQPYVFKLKDPKTPMVFAGIWDENINAGNKPIQSFSIITVPANKTVGAIHPRMPAILTPLQAKEWLELEKDPDNLKNMLKPFPDAEMESWRVSKLVNYSRNEGSDLIKQLT